MSDKSNETKPSDAASTPPAVAAPPASQASPASSSLQSNFPQTAGAPNAPQQVSSTAVYLIFAGIFLVLIVVAVVKLMDFFGDARRYSLAAKALETGNAQVAAAALAPDVGRGVGAGLGALGLGNARKF